MWFKISSYLLLLLLMIFNSGLDVYASTLEPFQATCPSTANMESIGPWSSGVKSTFDRAEIYVWNGSPQHLRCWYKSPVGGSVFIAGYNEVRQGYKCTIIDSNTFVCR